MLTSFSPFHIVFNFNLALSFFLLTHFGLIQFLACLHTLILLELFTLLSVVAEHTVCRLKAVHAVVRWYYRQTYCRLPAEHAVHLFNRLLLINLSSFFNYTLFLSHFILHILLSVVAVHAIEVVTNFTTVGLRLDTPYSVYFHLSFTLFAVGYRPNTPYFF